MLAAGVGVAGLVYVRRAAAERRAAHGVLLALLVAVPALGRVAFGVRETTTWSPVTLAYVVAQVPKGAVLAVNRSGFQLNAVTLEEAVAMAFLAAAEACGRGRPASLERRSHPR